MKTYYITDEQFDLLTEEQIDALNWEYYFSKLDYELTEQDIAEKEAMETDYQYCK
ncbi:hypothetical protein UFOVP424_15 [uncultured Caudovirales phage]|uniref:Uncharacterized protein n=1 Tax=uncultured Caudovirales phage TaxID=2100421 RepID=A0A6J5M6E2_9CAUD|nr:hypothetical protein UFOVP424_15 [uncultured Caudovirales phage]